PDLGPPAALPDLWSRRLLRHERRQARPCPLHPGAPPRDPLGAGPRGVGLVLRGCRGIRPGRGLGPRGRRPELTASAPAARPPPRRASPRRLTARRSTPRPWAWRAPSAPR